MGCVNSATAGPAQLRQGGRAVHRAGQDDEGRSRRGEAKTQLALNGNLVVHFRGPGVVPGVLRRLDERATCHVDCAGGLDRIPGREEEMKSIIIVICIIQKLRKTKKGMLLLFRPRDNWIDNLSMKES